MNDEHGHVAMPKLYGAPAYARPPAAPVNRVERPFDPDDLPIESERTSEDEDLVAQAAPIAPVSDGQAARPGRDAAGSDSRRAFRLRLPRLSRSGSQEPDITPSGE